MRFKSRWTCPRARVNVKGTSWGPPRHFGPLGSLDGASQSRLVLRFSEDVPEHPVRLQDGLHDAPRRQIVSRDAFRAETLAVVLRREFELVLMGHI